MSNDYNKCAFWQAENVFKGKVDEIRYESSNGQGSHFGIRIGVKKVYKGNIPEKEVRISAFKSDVIDLKWDTMVFDYSFQVAVDSTYIFFTTIDKGKKWRLTDK